MYMLGMLVSIGVVVPSVVVGGVVVVVDVVVVDAVSGFVVPFVHIWKI